MQWLVDRDTVDLAIVDLRTEAVTRVLVQTPVRSYAFSPDGRHVAYSSIAGFEANTQQPGYDLGLYEIESGEHRILASRIRLAYGIEWSWSPTGESLAYIGSGQLGGGAIVLVTVADGSTRQLGDEATPSFDPGDGEAAPAWSADGEAILAIGDGELWRIGVESGEASRVGAIDGWHMRALVVSPVSSLMWSSDGGRTAWVVARETGGGRSGIFAVDLVTGETRAAVQEQRSYYGLFNVDASNATGEIVFVASGLQHLADLWMLDTATNEVRGASRINDALDRYELGQARVIDWMSTEGEPLRGALLLPPGYRDGEPLPLVVFAYGGDYGSRSVNRFGLWGALPNFNMHLLATRGYAVLYPDAPLREGMAVADMVSTVLPGVNAAIEQGSSG